MTAIELNPPGASTRMARVRRRLMGLSPREADFEVRGFSLGGMGRERLELVGRAFIVGFNVGLEAGSPEAIGEALDELPVPLQGFAYEGAGMSSALLDRVWPPWWGHPRVESLLQHAPQHTYLVHVGVGWALARLGRKPSKPPEGVDALLGWLAFDGYGFHEGYFAWKRWLGPGEHPPPPLKGPAGRIFDQGLGRSLWFSHNADVPTIASVIDTFEQRRAEDLWSGIGLASTYAGTPQLDDLVRLRQAAGPYWIHVAQGSCFAAKARLRSGHVPEHTRVAVHTFCGSSVEAVAELCDSAMPTPRPRHEGADYLAWRAEIREQLRDRTSG